MLPNVTLNNQNPGAGALSLTDDDKYRRLGGLQRVALANAPQQPLSFNGSNMLDFSQGSYMGANGALAGTVGAAQQGSQQSGGLMSSLNPYMKGLEIATAAFNAYTNYKNVKSLKKYRKALQRDMEEKNALRRQQFDFSRDMTNKNYAAARLSYNNQARARNQYRSINKMPLLELQK